MNPQRIVESIKPLLIILLIVFLVAFGISFVANSDDDDDFTVTITYDCNEVLNEHDGPEEVVKECLELRNENQRRNN